MAKKSALSKALDKRKKKPAKKAIKQATPQSESYSVRRDKKEKAKPAGYRFKGLDNFSTPTKKQIAADAKKPRSKRKTYFENRKDKSDKAPSKWFEKGGIAIGKIGQELVVFMSDADNIQVNVHEYDNNQFILMIRKKGHQSVGLGNKSYKSFSGAVKSGLTAFKKNVPDLSQKLIEIKYKATESNKYIHVGGINNNYEVLIKEDRKTVEKKKFESLNAANKYALSFFNINIKKFELGGDINAHSGDNAITIQNEMFAKGGILPASYHKTFRLKGNGRREYNIFQPHTESQLKQAVRQLFPNMTYEEHKKLAKKYFEKAKQSKDKYNKSVDDNFMKEFGHKPGFGDYKVSGIWTDEFSDSAKQELRDNIQEYNQYRDAFSLHNSILKKSDKSLIDKFELGGTANIGAHSGDSATTVQDANVLEQGGPILPEDGTQTDVMAKGGLVKLPYGSMDAFQFVMHYYEIFVKAIDTIVDKKYDKIIKKMYETDPHTLIDPDVKFLNAQSAMGYVFYVFYKSAHKEKFNDGGEVESTLIVPENELVFSDKPEIEVKPEVEVKIETTQKATIPNIESAAYAENLIEFMGTNLEGKLLPNGDYVVLSFLFYPIWFYCAKDQKWYGNSDKYNSVTAMHMSNSRPTPNAEMLTCQQLLDRMNQGIQTYDLGGVLVRQLYPMSSDNAIAHQ